MKHFILATAGHVDHGKSALVKALTGTDPDRLPEEKARGITIELGFAELELEIADETFHIGIVDVPGHEDFIKNMVAGVGAIDLALLVVAADDGWMPQTEEHLQILDYLGVRRAVVALTKIDRAKSPDTMEAEVRTHLAGTDFHRAPVIQTSIIDGTGVEGLKAQLASEFSMLTPPVDIGKPRLAVDRAFTLRGIGTVVTGSLRGGSFRTGDSVVVQPAGTPTRIRAIQSHNREMEVIRPGARTALNLSDIPVARERGRPGVARGDVITLPDLGAPHAVVNAAVSRSPRLPASIRPLKSGTTVWVHHGSGKSLARIFFQDRDELAVGETSPAQLRFDEPVFIFAGDRFVVRDASERDTLAGGIVLDPDASTKNFRGALEREFLEKRMTMPDDVAVAVATQLFRDRVVTLPKLLVKSQFSPAQISSASAELCRDGRAVERGHLLIDAKWWGDCNARATALIEDAHRLHPDRIGIDLSSLRSELGDALVLPELFDALISELCRTGYARSGDLVRRENYQPSLPESLKSVGARIRTRLMEKPFDPPSRKELAPDAVSQQALRFLCGTGEVVKITDELFLTEDSFLKMRDAVTTHLRARGSASLSELRQTLESSRRVIVPFLEHLDAHGITRRTGDRRTLAAKA